MQMTVRLSVPFRNHHQYKNKYGKGCIQGGLSNGLSNGSLPKTMGMHIVDFPCTNPHQSAALCDRGEGESTLEEKQSRRYSRPALKKKGT